MHKINDGNMIQGYYEIQGDHVMEDNIIILLFIAIGLIKIDGACGIIFMVVVHVYAHVTSLISHTNTYHEHINIGSSGLQTERFSY